MGYKRGENREQLTIMPMCLDDYIEADSINTVGTLGEVVELIFDELFQHFHRSDLVHSQSILVAEDDGIKAVLGIGEQRITNKLSADDAATLEKLYNLQSEIVSYDANESFKCGFCIGALVMLEVLTSKEADAFE